MKKQKITERKISHKTLKDGTKLWYRENSSDLLMYNENPYRGVGLRSEDVIMDIGANMGDFPLRFSRKVKAIHSYEPMPDTFEVLKLNVDSNGFQNCSIYEKAVTTNTGEISFFLNETSINAHAGASIHKLRGRTEFKVQSISFEDEVKRINPSIIKMDIEGAEYDILNNVSDDLFKNSRIFIVEIHLAIIKDENPEEWSQRIGERFRSIYGSAKEDPVMFFGKKSCTVWTFEKN